MIKKLLKELGGKAELRIEQLWKTKQFVATADDAEDGCTEGKIYVLWVAQKDGKTQSGRTVVPGEWFIVEKV